MTWAINRKGLTLLEMLELPVIVSSFEKVAGNNASGVIASIVSLAKNNYRLQECEPNSVIAAAGQATVLHLPLDPALGCVFLNPYDDNGTKVAQFSIGTRGWIQLAIRSNAYKYLNSTTLYEGQFVDIDIKSGEVKTGERIGDNVVGYLAHYELNSGFQKDLFMSKAEMENHAATYSDSYRADIEDGTKLSVWSKAFNRMAEQTVLKLLLKRFGYISTDENSAMLAMAFKADQSVISKNNFTYVDNDGHTAPRYTPPLSKGYIESAVAEETPPWELRSDSDAV